MEPEDRSFHDANRGQKRSLKALKRMQPSSEEHGTVWNDAAIHSDRGRVVHFVSMVDNALAFSLALAFGLETDADITSLFDNRGALATFSSRILMGRILGIYGHITERDLTKLRELRNLFAHATYPVSLKEPAVVASINSFEMLKSLQPGPKTLTVHAALRGDVPYDPTRYLPKNSDELLSETCRKLTYLLPRRGTVWRERLIADPTPAYNKLP